MKHKKLVLLSSMLAAFAAVGQNAHAQAQPAAAATPTQGLQEIVITAERRSQNLQKAPIAVSAVSGDELLERGVSSASDLTKLVPSVTFAGGGGGSNQVTIRGIGALAGNGTLEQVVAFNMDGTYLARTSSVSGLYFDLERIEVVKGPQGTLYGRNATAGAVNVISRKPTLDKFGGDVTVTVGNYGLKKGEGAVNVPLSDTLGFRFAAQSVDRRGYLSDGYNDEKQTSVRGSMLAKLTDRLNLTLTADHVHVGGKGYGPVVTPYVDGSDPWIGAADPRATPAFSVPTIPNPFFNPGNPAFGPALLVGHLQPATDGYLDNDTSSFYGSLDWDTGAGKFTIIPSYRTIEIDNRHYAAGFRVDNKEDFTNKSLEARYASPDDNALRGVIGAYYFQESGSVDLFAYTLDALGVPPTSNRVFDTSTTAKALFGQATYDLTKTLRLIAGARYSEETKSINGVVFNAPFDGNQKFTKTTYKVGVEADLDKQSMVYFTVGTGFKAGGIFIAAAPNTYKPETITAVTLGSKNRFMDNRLQLNGELFYWKYKDKQVSHLGPVNPNPAQLLNLITENAGKATFSGAEVETRFLLTETDLITANLQYLNTNYDEYTYQQTLLAGPPLTQCKVGAPNAQLFVTVDCTGNEVAQAPKWSLALSYIHTMPLASGADVVFTLSSSIKSKFWIGEEHLPGQKQAGYGKTDVSVTYNAPGGNWSVTGFVNNVGDKAVVSNSFVDSIAQVVAAGIEPPRTYGARATLRF